MKNKLKIVIITENEPFYLADALRYFLEHNLNGYEIVSAYIINYFQLKRLSSVKMKISDVLRVFGFKAFLKALSLIIIGKLKKSKNVVKVFQEHEIPVVNAIKDINSPEVINSIKQQNPDLLIAIGVNSLFQKPLRNLARYGCLNVHSGIKVEHRGRAPIFWALADGCDETGITVHYIDERIDNGQILVTRKYKIVDRSLSRLIHDLRILGIDALIEALDKIRKEEKKYVVQTQADNNKIQFRPFPGLTDLKTFKKRGNRLF